MWVLGTTLWFSGLCDRAFTFESHGLFKANWQQGVAVHTYNHSMGERGEHLQEYFWEFKASLG